MSQVSATIELPGTVFDAETCWYDTSRWVQWVDQLERVKDVRGDWPRPGALVVWESGPAGRGTVRERVVSYEPRSGQTNEVEDDSIMGRQAVAFVPTDQGAEVRLTLDYTLKRRSPVSGLIDLLFIRRVMGASLAKTLTQFRAALEAPHTGTFE